MLLKPWWRGNHCHTTSKLEKIALISRKNALIVVIYGLNLSFKMQFLRVSSSKNDRFFLRGLSFSCCRSSHPRCSVKKGVLRNFTKFTGKQLSLCFNNKVAGLSSATLLKKKLWYRCFPVNFANQRALISRKLPWSKKFLVMLLGLNSGSAQIQILLAACRRFGMVRISENGNGWKA